MRPIAKALLLPNLLVLLSCAMPDPVIPTQPLTGDWGGAHVGLTLGAGGGRIEYDCAHGTLDVAVVPGPDGAFSVPGTHVSEGGPARIDAPPESMRTRYDGAVMGDRMTLRVQAGATGLGPFVLQRGAAAQLFKCL